MAFNGAYSPLTLGAAELLATPPHLITQANVTQASSVSSVAAKQTHLIVTANVTASSSVSSSAVKQTHLISTSNVSSANPVSSAAIKQTHLVGTANATQANAASASAIVQQAYVSVASVAQANRAIPTQIHEQRHYIMRVDTSSRIPGAMVIGDEGAALLGVANVSQASSVSSAAINLPTPPTFVIPVNVSQVNASSSLAVKQTHLATIANTSQANACSPAYIGSAHLVFCGGATQVNSASGAAIKQTTLLSVFNVTQANIVTPARVRMMSGHTMRVSTTPLITGAMVIGDVGLGVIGSEVPSSGDDGAGYLYNDITLPDDANKEIRGYITTWPTDGTLYAYEDSSFIYWPNPSFVGTDTFLYQLYIDGVASGSPILVELVVVGRTITVTFSDVAQTNVLSEVIVKETHLVTCPNIIQTNLVSSASIYLAPTHVIVIDNVNQTSTASPVNVTNFVDITQRVVAVNIAQTHGAQPVALTVPFGVVAASVVQDSEAQPVALTWPISIVIDAVNQSANVSGVIAINGKIITPDTVVRLSEIWARMELDPTNPVNITPDTLTVGSIYQNVSTDGASRTGNSLISPVSPDTQVLEVWQRLGLDENNPLVQTASALDFGTIHCEIEATGENVKVTRV